MKNADAATHQFKSKLIPWVAGDTAIFRNNGFIPARGPNGGILMIREITVHAILNMTVAVAVVQGEDCYRFARQLDLKTTGGQTSRRLDGITGDTARLISYAHLGASRTFEHADLAIAATTDRTFTCTIPLSKPWAYDPDDTALPSDFFEELRVGMATAAGDTGMSIGASVATIHSGNYWIVVDCFEQRSIVLPAIDIWRQAEFSGVSAVDIEVDTGGRLQDAFIYVPGANGGQTLANLTSVSIVGLMPEALLRTPDLRQFYARARQASPNSFSAKGNPLRTDPFTAADAGTHRALAVKLTTGSKLTDGPEKAKEVFKVTLAAALPAAARLVYRYTARKSEAQRAALQRTHGVNTSYVKTRDKSRRDLAAWPVEMRDYLPEKFLTVDPRTGSRTR